MATYQRFEDLPVWQTAAQLFDACDDFLAEAPHRLRGSFRNQLERAVLSVSNNIAEGFERGTRKEFIHFLNIAKGSNGEVRSQLYVALEQEYVTETNFAELKSTAVSLSRRIAKFIRYLESCAANTSTRKTSKR